MKFKPLLLVLVAAVCSTCTPCYATETAPKHYISLPVVMDDAAHAYMTPISFTAVPTPAFRFQEEPPAAPFSLAGNYSFSRRELSAVAIKSFDTLWPDIGGRKGFNVDLFGMVGANAEAALIGGGIGGFLPIHPRITLGLGLTLSKRGSTFEEFFADFKGFEVGVVGSITYQVRF